MAFGKDLHLPRVSVILPTFRRQAQLAVALDSALAQSLTNVQIIVIDDGSGDGTAEFVEQRYPGVELLSLAESVGPSEARNLGIRKAKAEFVAFLDDDDFWHPDFLRLQVEVLQSHLQSPLSFCGHVCLCDGQSRAPDVAPLVVYDDPAAHLLAEFYIHAMSLVVVRRRCLEVAGPLSPTLRVIHDNDLYLRLRRQGPFCHVPEVLATKVIQARSLTGGAQRWYEEEMGWLPGACAVCPAWSRRILAHRHLVFAVSSARAGDWGKFFPRLGRALGSDVGHVLRLVWAKAAGSRPPWPLATV